jgi:hypothetical protein
MDIEFGPGSHISKSCEQLAAKAKASGQTVRGKFNGIVIEAIPESTADQLVDWYRAECKREHEEHIKTPEYKAMMADLAAKGRKRKAEFSEAMTDAPPIAVKNAAEWNDWKEKNTDPYSAAALRFAENWARIMQKRIDQGESVALAASATQYIADDEGITGFMYGCAVHSLVGCWVYGEELRIWHNLDTQIGNEGEKANASGGVLNPAVLSIG